MIWSAISLGRLTVSPTLTGLIGRPNLELHEECLGIVALGAGDWSDSILSVSSHDPSSQHVYSLAVLSTFFHASSPPMMSSTSFLVSFTLVVICFAIGNS